MLVLFTIVTAVEGLGAAESVGNPPSTPTMSANKASRLIRLLLTTKAFMSLTFLSALVEAASVALPVVSYGHVFAYFGPLSTAPAPF